jgi:energy-coupling factor transporter ATP-binding protein EcfA2
MELAAAPLALFCDEPTSGLDSTSALKVAKILRTISRVGLTIVAVLHQPRVEIFSQFDDVLFLVPGGRTAYFGPVKLAKAYFESLGFIFKPTLNPADVMMDIVSGRGKRAPTADGGRQPEMSADDVVKAWETLGAAHIKKQMELMSMNSFLQSSNVLQPPTALLQNQEPSTMMQEGGPKDIEEQQTEQFQQNCSALNPSSAISPNPTTPPNNNISNNKLNITTTKMDIDAMAALAQARGASFLSQVYHSHNRSVVQQFRLSGALAMELFVGTFAGFIMGFAGNADEMYHGILVSPYHPLSMSPNEWFLGLYGTLIGVAIAASGGPAGCKIFGEEKGVYWREAASGHNRVAYFLVSCIKLKNGGLFAAKFMARLAHFLRSIKPITGQEYVRFIQARLRSVSLYGNLLLPIKTQLFDSVAVYLTLS